jgi:hypothetical protein
VAGNVHGLVYHYVLTCNEHMVLQALAECAHQDGTGVRPSVGRLVWMTGLSERTVQRVMKSFRARGVLLQTRPPGFHRPAEYRIFFGPLVRKAPYRSVHMGVTGTPIDSDAKGVSRAELGVSQNGMGVRAATPEPSSEPSAKTGSADFQSEGRGRGLRSIGEVIHEATARAAVAQR